MQYFRWIFFREARRAAVCILSCLCAGLFATFAYAAAPVAPPKKTRNASSESAPKPGWDFQAPDRSAQNARWRESIKTTLQRTTFAPSAPAGRYLRHNAGMPGKGLPPAQLDDLDKVRPPENKQSMAGGKASMHGEFTKERIGWRPYNNFADSIGVTPALKEERRAGAYAELHPDEDVELKLGPECYLGSSALRPEQTGAAKDHHAAFGLGMRLKIDF